MSRRFLETEPGCFSALGDNVVPLVTAAAVDAAWEEYASKARELAADTRLLCDRRFNEDLARSYAKWRRLYLRTEHAG